MRPPEPVYEPGGVDARLTPVPAKLLRTIADGAVLQEREQIWTEWKLTACWRLILVKNSGAAASTGCVQSAFIERIGNRWTQRPGYMGSVQQAHHRHRVGVTGGQSGRGEESGCMMAYRDAQSGKCAYSSDLDRLCKCGHRLGAALVFDCGIDPDDNDWTRCRCKKFCPTGKRLNMDIISNNDFIVEILLDPCPSPRQRWHGHHDTEAEKESLGVSFVRDLVGEHQDWVGE